MFVIFLMEPFQAENSDFLYYLSAVLGWIYFFSWSLCFYGQVIENYRRKSVKGLCFDFEVYNIYGFTGYSIYTIWGYVDNDMGTGIVQIQDIIFAVHALIITSVTVLQICIYYQKGDPEQTVSIYCILLISVLFWGATILIFLEYILNYYDPHVSARGPNEKYVFNSVIYLGWCKVLITLIKYAPQAYSNYIRKSTIGWNIHNILFDITGGSFSFAQNIVDTFRPILPGETPRELNIAKYALSFVSILYDLLFLTQHYILYKQSNSDLQIRQTLLSESNNKIDINNIEYNIKQTQKQIRD